MDTKQAMISVLNTAHMIVEAYVGDMDDQDLMTRPHPESNHINWQIGHLIASDHHMITQVFPNAIENLPDGFVDKYQKETQNCDDFSRFDDKETLLKLANQQKAAIQKVIEDCDPTDFSKEAPDSMKSYCPSVGDMFCMIGSHWLMHCGQWVIVRRIQGKPVVI